MPYVLDGNCVKKKHPDGTLETLKCYDNHADALSYFRALEIHVKDSMIVEQSMTITKASFDPKTQLMRFRMVCSDTGPDVYDERMSLQLFNDFTSRIETNTNVPMPFKSILKEKSGWDGGMPYISIAHYKSGKEGKNIPADTEKVYVDGECLKATAICKDNQLGKAVFKSLKDDLENKSDYQDKIRVSIGFLDLMHSHGDYVFERTTLEKECPMCKNNVGNKVYLKGQLVHLALTRKPANPRTDTEVDDMAKEIMTRKDDAESIVGESLAEEIEVNKSTLDTEENNILTVKAETTDEKKEIVEEAMPSDHTGKADCTCKACQGKKKDMPMKAETEEVVTKVEEVTKSEFDKAVDKLKSHILEVKSMNREDALKELQPDFELVAKAVQDEFVEPTPAPVATIDPALSELLTSMKSMIADLSGKVGNLSTEITILKSQAVVANTQKSETTIPAPRNLQVERSVTPVDPITNIQANKPLSIKELALRSVQAQS